MVVGHAAERTRTQREGSGRSPRRRAVLPRGPPWRAARGAPAARTRRAASIARAAPGPRTRSRRHIEFCENGAKAVAHEATRRRIARRVLRAPGRSASCSSAARPAGSRRRAGSSSRSCRWRGSDRYEPIALGGGLRAGRRRAARSRVAGRGGLLHLRAHQQRGGVPVAALRPPVRHQQSPGLLEHVPRVERHGARRGDRRRQGHGRASTTSTTADAIFMIGQNPGTNHPRMLTTLLAAKRRGCRIVSVNPLRERGLVRFAHPQEALALLGRGTRDRGSLPPGAGRRRRRAAQGHHEGSARRRGASARPGARLGFHRATTPQGFERFRAALEAAPFEDLECARAASRASEMREAAAIYAGASA